MTQVRPHSTARNREIGDLLRAARQRAEMTLTDMAERLGNSPSMLSNIEVGRRGTTVQDLMLYLGHCGAERELADHVQDLATRRDTGYLVRSHRSHVSDELRALILHENMAEHLISYQTMIVPGLLQDEGYARAIIMEADGCTAEEAEPFVQIRLNRQKLLLQYRGPRLSFFVHETALHLEAGDTRVMRDQMLRLALMSSWPNIELRIVPASAGARALLRSQYVLMCLPKAAPVVYVEGEVASLFLENVGQVSVYEHMIDKLDHLARDEGESRAEFARLADHYDRRLNDGDGSGEQLWRRWAG
ncbi:helix-turn-helix domain-containing protein [Umezawaea beigongshangensis]|uniref:helix-turn-helix domain-containing protein n=1 Tax=Umezawaea beigongshangensis TaxID=2780383 RepID=UPI0018F184F6|nr:helix-turn-helix transcriptional regulator [Umezawaea beigongshangensis]